MGDARVRILGLHSAIALSVALLLSACGSKPPPKPASVTGTIEATAQVNPSASKRPSPLLVRIYELKSVAAFNAADFMSLYQRDQAELAADLVTKEEFVMSPGETKTFAKTLGADTRFLGVVAAYRDLEHAKWRSVVPIQPSQPHKVMVRAGELAVEATIVK
jgi:type VI secretion system protein VasD